MASDKANHLFDSSDESDGEADVQFNVDNNYAQKYNDWRRKEELQKLKDKYGESLDIMSEIEDDSDSGSNSEEDEEDEESDSLSDEPFDEDFLKVYSALKNKDPKIYSKSFDVNADSKQAPEDEVPKSKTKDDTKKLTLQQYHQKLIEEKKGITEEDEQMLNTDEAPKPSGYYEELYNIRREIKDIVTHDDDHEHEEQLFSVKGNSEPVVDRNSKVPPAKKEQFMTNIWNNGKHLDKSDEYLRDFIVNKRYLNATATSSFATKDLKQVETHFGGFDTVGEGEEGSAKDDDDSETEEETANLKSQMAISKYHFEEPDANVIKRYPRSVGSIRETIKSEQKSHRAELREKKKQEKAAELKRLRKLKREETESKIQRLKQISGNQGIDIKDLDLNVIIDDEKEFDMEKYDQKMQLLFGDSYYNTEANESKPVFEYDPDIDDDLYNDPPLADKDSVQQTGKANKKRSKKDIKKTRDIMADDDIGIYEDIIAGNIATRFKYRMVEPNDFGLTDEEILYGDDQELNRWCSLKKMSQFRSREEEEYDKKVYARKTTDLNLKKKILKSLYSKETKEEESPAHQATVQEEGKPISQPSLKTKRGKKRRKKNADKSTSNSTETNCPKPVVQANNEQVNKNLKKSRKRKRTSTNKNSSQQVEAVGDVSVQRLKAYGMSNREIKRMKIHK